MALAGATASAGAGPAPQHSPVDDPLRPRSSRADALVSPLAGIVIAVAEPDAVMRLLTRGFDMQLVGSAGRAGRVLAGAGGAGEARITVRSAGSDALARPGHDSRRTGGLAIGFPLRGQARRMARLAPLGLTPVAGVVPMTLPAPGGGSYIVEETHYRLPDGLLALGIDRGAMAPVGAVDPRAGIGGPAYASAVVADRVASGRLLADVLGLERRRAFDFTSAGPDGGLALPAGTRVTLEQWYAPGAESGYVILLDLHGRALPAASASDDRGMRAWQFRTDRLDDIAARAASAGIAATGPERVRDAAHGCVRRLTMVLEAPLDIEVLEPATGCR